MQVHNNCKHNFYTGIVHILGKSLIEARPFLASELTRQRSSMARPPPNTAWFLKKWSVLLGRTSMRVLSRVMPPPMFPSNRHNPENVVGNRKAAIALVSIALSRDVLFVKVLYQI